MSKREDVLNAASRLLAADPAIFNKHSSLEDVEREITGCVNIAICLVDAVDEWEAKRPKPTVPKPLPTAIPYCDQKS